MSAAAVVAALALAALAPAARAGDVAVSCPDSGVYTGDWLGGNPPVAECYEFYDSGEFTLGEWDTNTTTYYPDSDYALEEYYHWTSSSSVTVASSTSGLWDSATYTNWSISTSHYGETTVEADSATIPDSCPCEMDAPIPAPVPYTGSRAAPRAATIVPAQRPPSQNVVVEPVSATSPTSVSVECATSEVEVHAEGLLTFRKRPSGLKNEPQPVVTETFTGASATLDGRKLPATAGAMLHLTVVCGLADKKQVFKSRGEGGGQHRRHVIVGSTANETLQAQPGGSIVYAGRGTKQLIGRTGNDVLYGGPGTNTLRGRGDSDVLIGGSGATTLVASPLRKARTLLVAGTGANTLIAGPGRNFIDSRKGSGANEIRCAGKSIVRARHSDKISGHCTKVIYSD